MGGWLDVITTGGKQALLLTVSAAWLPVLTDRVRIKKSPKHKSDCACFKGYGSSCSLWPSCKSWLLRFSFAPLDSNGVKRQWGTWLWKETLLTMSHFNLSPFWALWCKWVTDKPQVGWKSFLFLKIMLSPQGWEYVKSLQAIYFGPAKVRLGAGGTCAGALSRYRTHPLDREVFCSLHWNEIQGRLIGLLIGGQKVCNYTRNWNQPQTGSSSASNYFYLFTVCVHVTFYDMFLRDSCFFKHLLTETINHNCSGKELLTLQFASKKSCPTSWGVKDSVGFHLQER